MRVKSRGIDIRRSPEELLTIFINKMASRGGRGSGLELREFAKRPLACLPRVALTRISYTISAWSMAIQITVKKNPFFNIHYIPLVPFSFFISPSPPPTYP